MFTSLPNCVQSQQTSRRVAGGMAPIRQLIAPATQVGFLIHIKGCLAASKSTVVDATSRREINMRLWVIAAVISLTPVSAFAVSDCRVTGNPSVFGVDMTAYVAIKSGETCNFPIRIPGIMNNAGVASKPAHGMLKQLNMTTFRYTAKSGYRGNDTFAIYGEGKGPFGSGRSVITVNATVE
ncbi:MULTISPECIES: hypothetical protein [Bradyrhizobium]|uniref:hypothetical protein n=1 Tax=Bradyrhizobium TaxID=374 RepID=UPI00293F0B5E|nr:hypothetical protein [Bradyrhizobium sp. NDS-1]WOH72126.1 hypothetical protein RX330_28130 [Bradyrhizobium sp. NDS-1]